MVDKRPCLFAQSPNFLDCLISVSVVAGSKRPANSKSATADFGFFGSTRPADRTVAIPTTPPPLW